MQEDQQHRRLERSVVEEIGKRPGRSPSPPRLKHRKEAETAVASSSETLLSPQ